MLSFLESGVSKLNLELPKSTLEKLVAYVELLQKWNKTYNLTSVREPKSIIIRHIFDSLSIVPFVKGPDILDFGTGAGLPGIPLALALPEYSFVLLDSVRKKTTFLNHVVLSLGIKNVEVVNSRIETFRFRRSFATIVTRATASLEDIIEKTERFCSESGQILVMKGKKPEEEMMAIKKAEMHRIVVPYLEEERCVVRMICCKQNNMDPG